MVKLRLKRMGSIDKPFYRIVILDSRKKRDGIYLESIGYYDPKTDPFTLKVDTDRAIHWLGLGAQPSDTVRSLLKKAGILQKWHEMKFAAKAEDTDKEEIKEAKKKTAKPKKEKEVEEIIEEPIEAVEVTAEEPVEILETTIEATVEAEEETVEVAVEAKMQSEEPIEDETKTEEELSVEADVKEKELKPVEDKEAKPEEDTKE